MGLCFMTCVGLIQVDFLRNLPSAESLSAVPISLVLIVALNPLASAM